MPSSPSSSARAAREALAVRLTHLCGFSHADVVLAMLHEAIVRPPYDVPLPVPRFAGGPSLRKRAS
ncbi:hypothetical protein FFZ77_01145 [Streptomyces katsurahamanus]|uniref:Uncharacterized protein n=1 Tax=Streptomyces katsurahamanus TaxID=2577098 RepID=A0ABW9NMB0_9ACTN|nr:hypothetical protein [Streptomyces katsurahamanus]